jgi:hypothetical protein
MAGQYFSKLQKGDRHLEDSEPAPFLKAIRLTIGVGTVRDRDDAALVRRSLVPRCVVAACGIHVIRGMPGIVPMPGIGGVWQS